ncbi:MAG: uncharacterized protein KVP18_001446 [Porospora cf. gigantea A]|uniref:uncharacterized protein n=1 Tax=Porospora cf. gigantea A TaxID=2853593 RepID=UPI00355A5A48|nr:MAG: hypothetical protein KVP18_001446 [Porospora cf. gigantea A]
MPELLVRRVEWSVASNDDFEIVISFQGQSRTEGSGDLPVRVSVPEGVSVQFEMQLDSVTGRAILCLPEDCEERARTVLLPILHSGSPPAGELLDFGFDNVVHVAYGPKDKVDELAGWIANQTDDVPPERTRILYLNTIETLRAEVNTLLRLLAANRQKAARLCSSKRSTDRFLSNVKNLLWKQVKVQELNEASTAVPEVAVVESTDSENDSIDEFDVGSDALIEGSICAVPTLDLSPYKERGMNTFRRMFKKTSKLTYISTTPFLENLAPVIAIPRPFEVQSPPDYKIFAFPPGHEFQALTRLPKFRIQRQPTEENAEPPPLGLSPPVMMCPREPYGRRVLGDIQAARRDFQGRFPFHDPVEAFFDASM